MEAVVVVSNGSEDQFLSERVVVRRKEERQRNLREVEGLSIWHCLRDALYSSQWNNYCPVKVWW
jgi:hypothetical protein